MKITKEELKKKLDKENISKTASIIKEKVGNTASSVANKTKDIVESSKDIMVDKMDVNGDGAVDIEDIIILGLRTPGIGINRAEFLQKELSLKYSQDVISKAIETTPKDAGIPIDVINKIADNVIAYERNCVSGISAALSTPGGVVAVATIPADIIQYYGYMIRTAQKLMYLYGFPEINVKEQKSQFDTETLNVLTLCLGVMYGVAGANRAILAISKAFAAGVEHKLIHMALTKGTIYPIVKGVASWFKVRMTKEVFAGFFKKSIPVVGGIIGGGLTYVSFKPCCVRLQKSLQDTMLSNPNYVDQENDDIVIDVEVNE